MPLHLLGKKSWNVYNVANIEKVKRDEAIARAEEEAQEQRMQENDAKRRLQILRGETPTPIAHEGVPRAPDADQRERRDHGSGRERKRRKRAGENDTDFEMRIAADQTTSADAGKQISLRKESNAPLVDQRGHIDLFPQKIEKHPEVETEVARKRKEYEDQYTVRFSNAAGFQQQLSAPWYSKTGTSRETVSEDISGKNAFGREDPHRKERDTARIASNDPLAMMKAGARQVREVKRERELWVKEKEREIRELEVIEARNKRKRRHRDDESELEDFQLDDKPNESRERSRERHSSRSRRHRDTSRERRHHRKESRRSSHREDSRERSKHRRRHHD